MAHSIAVSVVTGGISSILTRTEGHFAVLIDDEGNRDSLFAEVTQAGRIDDMYIVPHGNVYKSIAGLPEPRTVVIDAASLCSDELRAKERETDNGNRADVARFYLSLVGSMVQSITSLANGLQPSITEVAVIWPADVDPNAFTADANDEE